MKARRSWKNWAFTPSEMASRRLLSREGQVGAQSFFGYTGNDEGRKTNDDVMDVHQCEL